MTLRDLLSKCSYKSVFNILYKEHYKDKENSEVEWYDIAYLGAWNQLINKESKPNKKYKICLRERVDPGVPGRDAEDDYFDPPEKFIEVCLYNNEDGENYAIDLILWEDLIDAEIISEALIDDNNILAEILWEITFYGFTDDRIKSQKAELEDLSRRIDNGEEELIPFDVTILDELSGVDK